MCAEAFILIDANVTNEAYSSFSRGVSSIYPSINAIT